MEIIDPMVDADGMAEEIAANGKGPARGHDRDGNPRREPLVPSGAIGVIADIDPLMGGWPQTGIGPPFVAAAEEHSRIEIEVPDSGEALIDGLEECEIGDGCCERDGHR